MFQDSRASLNRTSWSEILKLGMYEIQERDYLISMIFFSVEYHCFPAGRVWSPITHSLGLG